MTGLGGRVLPAPGRKTRLVRRGGLDKSLSKPKTESNEACLSVLSLRRRWCSREMATEPPTDGTRQAYILLASDNDPTSARRLSFPRATLPDRSDATAAKRRFISCPWPDSPRLSLGSSLQGPVDRDDDASQLTSGGSSAPRAGIG